MTTLEKVFLDYTQDELDNAYEQTIWAPNFPELRARARSRSDEIRTRHPNVERSYGPSADETFEILPTAQSGAPVLMFVHGGRWLPQPENAFIYFADTLTAAGAHFAAARFVTLTPTPGKTTMRDMVEQLRRAVVWLYRNAASFGGDPERIHVLGHSSGAHLTSVLLTTDWAAQGVPPTVLKSGTCVSGMYDLRPVLLSARSSYVKLTAADEDEFSAMRHLDRVRCPVTVAYGDKESPEFQRHGREFAAALQASGHRVTPLVMAGCNHFEGIQTMTDATSPLARAVMRPMGLAAAP
jgi:arylformamidase